MVLENMISYFNADKLNLTASWTWLLNMVWHVQTKKNSAVTRVWNMQRGILSI